MRLYRYGDLVAMKIVSNRVTLRRWQKHAGFPQSIKLGPGVTGSIAFDANAVDAWVAACAAKAA
jgi:predicted DNA-binding transcriptional regulator AlpA